MKKESSRLLKTGHRVSYSPRKEKALKIYLDGGPAKDPGQDWEWAPWCAVKFFLMSQPPMPHQGSITTSKPTSTPRFSHAAQAWAFYVELSGGIARLRIITRVYCTVKFKGKCKSRFGWPDIQPSIQRWMLGGLRTPFGSESDLCLFLIVRLELNFLDRSLVQILLSMFI